MASMGLHAALKPDLLQTVEKQGCFKDAEEDATRAAANVTYVILEFGTSKIHW